MNSAESIKYIRESFRCSLQDANRMYEEMIDRIKSSERNVLLDQLFIQDSDGMCEHFEHRALRVDWYLEKKYPEPKKTEEDSLSQQMFPGFDIN